MSNTSKFHITLKNVKNSVSGAQDPMLQQVSKSMVCAELWTLWPETLSHWIYDSPSYLCES